MKTPNKDVGTINDNRLIVTTPKSNTVVLGASMPYDSLKALEQTILNDDKLNVLRDIKLRPNKTDLVKMSLLYFFKSKISKENLLELYNSSNDEKIFQEDLV